MIDEPSYLTSCEFAADLGISEQTLRKSRVTGKLLGVDAPGYVKWGRLVRYPDSERQRFKTRLHRLVHSTAETSAQRQEQPVTGRDRRIRGGAR